MVYFTLCAPQQMHTYNVNEYAGLLFNITNKLFHTYNLKLITIFISFSDTDHIVYVIVVGAVSFSTRFSSLFSLAFIGWIIYFMALDIQTE